eukprot:7387631-Prymnesium_polylepis.1
MASGPYRPASIKSCGVVLKKVPNSQPWRAGSFSWSIAIGTPDARAPRTSPANASPTTGCKKVSSFKYSSRWVACPVGRAAPVAEPCANGLKPLLKMVRRSILIVPPAIPGSVVAAAKLGGVCVTLMLAYVSRISAATEAAPGLLGEA